MDLLEEFWIPLRLTGFGAWALSCAMACWLLLRSSAVNRRHVMRLAATYLVVGGLSMIVTAFVLGQHYSYTDVVLNDEPLGFDLDYFVRHCGIAVICGWLAWRLAPRARAALGSVVMLAAVCEMLVRADNTALLVLLEPSLQEGGWAGAVLPPVAGAIGSVLTSRWLHAPPAPAAPRGAGAATEIRS